MAMLTQYIFPFFIFSLHYFQRLQNEFSNLFLGWLILFFKNLGEKHVSFTLH